LRGEGKIIRKVIVVPGRLVNIAAGQVFSRAKTQKAPLIRAGFFFEDQALKPTPAVRIAVHSLLLGKRRNFQIEAVPFLAQSGV